VSSEVQTVNQSFSPLVVPSRKRSKRKTSSWDNLSNLLESFGINKEHNSVSLNWEKPEKGQFDVLIKMLSLLSNTNLNGSYSDNTKEWIVSL
jgi:hypothetical protein